MASAAAAAGSDDDDGYDDFTLATPWERCATLAGLLRCIEARA
jgi:hypothetical protein